MHICIAIDFATGKKDDSCDAVSQSERKGTKRHRGSENRTKGLAQAGRTDVPISSPSRTGFHETHRSDREGKRRTEPRTAKPYNGEEEDFDDHCDADDSDNLDNCNADASSDKTWNDEGSVSSKKRKLTKEVARVKEEGGRDLIYSGTQSQSPPIGQGPNPRSDKSYTVDSKPGEYPNFRTSSNASEAVSSTAAIAPLASKSSTASRAVNANNDLAAQAQQLSLPSPVAWQPSPMIMPSMNSSGTILSNSSFPSAVIAGPGAAAMMPLPYSYIPTAMPGAGIMGPMVIGGTSPAGSSMLSGYAGQYSVQPQSQISVPAGIPAMPAMLVPGGVGFPFYPSFTPSPVAIPRAFPQSFAGFSPGSLNIHQHHQQQPRFLLQQQQQLQQQRLEPQPLPLAQAGLLYMHQQAQNAAIPSFILTPPGPPGYFPQAPAVMANALGTAVMPSQQITGVSATSSSK